MSARDGDFTRLWAGQTISKFGSGIGGAALDLTAVLTLGASPAQMGLLGAARMAPVVVLGLAAGAWVDRLRRRPLMIWADVGRAALLALIPLAAVVGWLRLELLFVVAPLVGVLGVLFDVAYQSFVPILVTRERLMHANSRLATSDALAEITTPGLAGLLAQLITAPMALLCDAVSFLVSAVSVALVRTAEPPPAPSDARPPLLAEIREGLALVAGSPVLRALAGFRATRELFGNFIGPLYALYALRELEIGPVLLGVSIGVGGASNLLGTLIVERVTRRFGIGPTIMVSQTLASFTVLTLPLAASAAAIGGPLWGFIFLAAGQASDLIHPLYDVNTLSLRQATTPDHLLGRVNASMQVIEGALWPLGAVLGGVLGGLIGIQATLFIAAAGIIASRVWLAFSPVPRLRGVPGLAQD